MSIAATSPSPTLAAPRASQSPAALRRAAQDFEAQALAALLQPMFQGLDTKAPFGGGSAEGQWRPMLVDAIARDLAKAGGLGIGEAVLRELTRLAGLPPNGDPPAGTASSSTTERPTP
ncbi:rod-binding protein [Roseomonas frigidaquae]|uniref:Rod-binding protein n=1 Tax=Falsiroseomonas frigidaquae TaxID=487318 RepID=A0ABX1F542_9PROT|nr:rod-binding protein [Falsiroseomonas frigidaquae]NKE47496.1 rod-binding protein [Falsiroseomonas frigidaquae]